MTTETDLAPVAATPATAPATLPEPAAEPIEGEQAADDAAPGTADPGEISTEPEGKKDDAEAEVDKVRRKMQRRIDRLTADKAAALQRAQDLAEAAAEAARRAETEDDGTKPAKAEDPREIAKTLRLVEKTAEATAKVMKDGKKFSDFEAAIAELVEEVGPQIDQTGRPSSLMRVVLDSDAPADVLYHLGKNPEVAAELVGLTEGQIGRRIAKLESELAAAAKPKPSAAAKPLTPVKPSAAVVVDETKLTDAQWHAQRRKARMG